MSINTNRSSPTQVNTSTNNYVMTPTQVGLYWSQVSIGPSHTIAIATDGTLWGWGYNNVGQVGNSTLINQSSPVQIASGSWTHVHADINYSLALRDDDLLFGWGYNQYGQLGSNIAIGGYRSSPVQINSTSWSTVSSGTNHVVAIKSDSTLWGWGYNNLGQLGDTSYINTSSPIQIGTSSYNQVGAGSNYTTALTINNKVITFGDNTYGQLGYNVNSTIQSWTMITGTGEYTLAIRNDGLLFGWGLNSAGHLGLNDTFNRSSPTQIGTNSWIFISANGGNAGAAPAAIRSDGTLWAWGNNNIGQIGDGTVINRSSPVQVSGGGSWSIVSAGQSHKLAVTSTGLLYGWGLNSSGQLGQANVINRSAPIQITTGLSFVSIGTSLTSSYALTNDGKLYAWGAGTNGRLGLSDTLNRSSPVQVGNSSWTSVYSTSDGAVYAIKSNNKLYAWGYNYGIRGSLGTNDTLSRSSPVQIHSNDWKTTINAIAGISAGNTFGIQSDGSLWAWGLQTIELASEFVTPTFTYSWTQISAGDSHTVGIRSDGRLFAWGKNDVGQLGTNDVAIRSSPVQIGTSQNEGEFWYSVSAKGSRTVAIRSDSTLWTWGLNSGYVGLSDSVNRSSPVQISTAPVTSYTQISAGIDHTLALTSTGQLYAWGNNNAYQLGFNDGIIRSTPVQISGSFAQIATGNSHSLVVDTNSKLFVWGDNTVGQAGTSGNLKYWTSVNIGTFSTTAYAIRNDGALYSWGSDSSGNFGTNNASATQRSSPVQIGSSSWSMIAAGRSHTLAIKADGTLWAWGANASGELADAVPVGGARSSPVQLGTSSWSFIAAGYASSAGIDITGKLYTWGINTSGLLGTSDTINRSNVTQIGKPSSWTQVGFTTDNAGSTFAIRNDGSLFTWGPGGLGVLGDNATLTRSSPVQVHTGVKYISMSGGPNAMFGIRDNQSLWAWGYNNTGQLGDNTTVNKSSPIQVAPGYVFKQVAGGTASVQALTTGGLLFAWGSNANGQLGDNTVVTRSSPVQIGALSWEFVSTGNTNVFGITRGLAPTLPNLYAWGDTITSGTTPGRSSPVQVQSFILNQFVSSPTQIGTSSWVSVGAGASYSLGATSTGSLYAWGSNSDGQVPVITSTTILANPNSTGSGYINSADNNLFTWGYGGAGQIGDNTVGTNKLTPINITKLTGIKFKYFAQTKTSTSGYTLAISTDNKLYGWGANNGGNLGTNDTIFRSMPIQIGNSSWTSVATGLGFTIALKADNTLWGWGTSTAGADGELSWSQVSAGASHTLILRSDKQLFGFGSNTGGQLGDLTVVARSSPTQIHTGALYNSIAAGTNISAGIREDNTLWTWGINTNGALGLGDTLNRSSPVQVNSLTNAFWSQVTASDYMLAQSNTFGIYGWGLNTGGQLGNSTVVSRSSPVQLPFAGSIYSNYGSNFFNGSNSYLTVSTNAAFGFGTGDFTIEFWVYPTVNARQDWVDITNGTQRALVYYSGSAITFYSVPPNSAAITGPAMTLNVWTHIAVSKESGSTKMFVNGSQVGSTYATSQNYGATNSVTIGKDSAGSTYATGYISNVRVIKGQALYTTNFTPSTTPLTTTSQGATASNVSLLTCQSNSFIDNSNNAFSVVSNGSTQLSGLNPFDIPSGVNNTVVRISAGSASLLVNYDNKLYTWGLNTAGQLGLNDTFNRSSPAQIGSGSWSQVSAGTSHAIAISSDNTLWTWGLNNAGQLGLNDVVNRSSPTQIGTSSWSIVTAGNSFTSGIKTDGTVWTWGNNATGQLGITLTTNRSSPVQVGTSSWSQVSAGGSQVVAIQNDNWQNVYVWGAGTLGLNGTNSIINRSSPVQIAASVLSLTRSSPAQISSSSDWSVISTADNAGYAIKSNGTLWAWGLGANGRLAQNDTLNRSSPTQIGTSSWIAIAGGRSFVAGVTTDGTLYTWGQNTQGQLGQGDIVDRSNPVQIAGSWTAVSCGETHVIALKTDGTTWAWGLGTSGQLGAFDIISRSSPVQVSTAVAFSAITAGSLSSYGYADNILYGWGGGGQGQLADGTTANKSSPIVISSIWYNNDSTQSSPTQIGVGMSWSTVAAGPSTSVALESTGELFTWGNNASGQMGNASTISRSSIVQIGTSSFSMIAAGGINTYAIKPTTNLLFGWGAGITLGDTTTVSRSSPVQVYTGTIANPTIPMELATFLGSSYTQVQAGSSVVTVTSSSGLLYTWGNGVAGQLGTQNINVVVSSPVLVGGQAQTYNASPAQISTSSYTQISAGYRHALAIKNDSTLYGWGNFAATAPATNAYSWKKVAAGQSHYVAIRGDNTLWGWGLNLQGQLGLSDTVNRSVPTQIGINTYLDIAAGASFTAAITTDNDLYAWGQNNSGQLGQGGLDTISRSSPVQIGSATITEPDAYSVLFNGGQILTVASSSAFAYGAGDYTVEFWFYMTTATGGYENMYVQSGGANSQGPIIRFGNGGYGTLLQYSTYGPGVSNTRSVNLTQAQMLNKWYHIALVKSSGLVAFYLNGTLQLTGGGATPSTFTLDYYTDPYNSVLESSPTIGNLFNGYISNLRVLNGTALYTSNFIPTTTPLTAIANTSLLTCQNKTKIDNSSNALSITGTGIAGQLQSPFVGYSVEFTGSNYLTLGTNAVFAIGTADFTIEAWVLPTTLEQFTAVIFGGLNSGVSSDWNLFCGTNLFPVFQFTNSVSDRLTSAIAMTQNAWNHVAVSRQSGTSRIFINGVLGNSSVAFAAKSLDNTLSKSIGAGFDGNASTTFVGYISNLRIVSGTALYTSNFIPSIYNLPAVSGTILLTCQSSTIVDNSSNNLTITNNQNAVATLSQNPITYNANSILFNGTSQFLTVAAGAPGSGNYTIECWIYTSDYYNGTAYAGIFDSRASGTDAGGISLYYKSSGANLIYRVAGTDLILAPSASTQLNGWNHIAIVRNSGVVTMYINGTSAGSASNSTNHTNTSFWIGKTFDPYYFGGYISNFRMVYGSAVYTSNFVPSADPLTAITNTVLLTCQNPIIVDNSVNAFTITQTGSPTEGAPNYTPFSTYLGSNSKFNSIRLGMSHGMALSTDSTLYVWGNNTYGQLGTESTATLYTPTQITPGVSYYSITAGGGHSGAIDINQNLYVWGYNGGGQLAQSNTLARSSPIQVGSFKWSSVTTIGTIVNTVDFTIAIRTDGTLWAWGANNSGQLGINDTLRRSSPVQIGTDYWSTLYEGSNNQTGSMMVQKSNGSLFAWGLNSSGQLGLNDILSRSSPVQVSTSFNFANSGAYSTTVGAFFDTVGQLYTTGVGTNGELGDGSIAASQARSTPVQIGEYYPSSPVQISTDSWTQISAGNDLSLGVKTNDTLYAWGLNTSYQTGIGTGQAIISSPTAIGTTISSTSAGSTAGGYIKNA